MNLLDFFREPMRRVAEESRAFLNSPQARRPDIKIIVTFLVAALCLTTQRYVAMGDQLKFVAAAMQRCGLQDLSEQFDRVMWESDNAQLNRLTWWACVSLATNVLIPMLLIRLVFRERLRDYGLKLGGVFADWWVYVLMMAVAAPVIVIASAAREFQQTYPFYTLSPGGTLLAEPVALGVALHHAILRSGVFLPRIPGSRDEAPLRPVCHFPDGGPLLHVAFLQTAPRNAGLDPGRDPTRFHESAHALDLDGDRHSHHGGSYNGHFLSVASRVALVRLACRFAHLPDNSCCEPSIPSRSRSEFRLANPGENHAFPESVALCGGRPWSGRGAGGGRRCEGHHREGDQGPRRRGEPQEVPGREIEGQGQIGDAVWRT
jgi:hypothetical protein